MPAGIVLENVCFAIFLVLFQQGGGPVVPGTFPPPQPARPSLPSVDGPPTVVRGERRVPLNAAKLKEEANQLAQLAQSIPTDVDKATKGRLAQDLAARLKQIEKLSKQLRRDISP